MRRRQGHVWRVFVANKMPVAETAEFPSNEVKLGKSEVKLGNLGGRAPLQTPRRVVGLSFF
jgi:hypothetical protein